MDQDLLLAISLVCNVALWATLQQTKDKLNTLKDNAKRFAKY